MTTGIAFSAALERIVFEHFQAVDFRQLQVEQDDGGVSWIACAPFAFATQVIDSFLAVARHDHFVGKLAFAERHEGQFEIAGIVFDKQNGFQHGPV